MISKKHQPQDIKSYPLVTIQLPIYNEGDLVIGLLESVSKIDYPKEFMEIQVLDDSTDRTLDISKQGVETLKQQGFNINLAHRIDRSGYKAGALAEGLQYAKGDFIAIFDADFRPESDFFTQLLPEFDDVKVGVVQAKWGHINKEESLLTKLQAFQLDVHFSIEQKGRQRGDLLLQFNGTCGIWRHQTIKEAGGWEGDTLTEDLDLSYRAQMKGWKIVYREDYEVPGLLPYTMTSLKSQQFRWMKGGAENAIKHFGNIQKSKLGFKQKYFALHHLLGSYVFIAILIAAVASLPLSHYIEYVPVKLSYASVFMLPLFITIIIYFVANRKAVHPLFFFLRFFQFLSLSMGMSMHNSKAVYEAIIRKKTAFIRTPKEKKNQGSAFSSSKVMKYIGKNPIVLMEAILGLYFVFGIYISILNHNTFLCLYYLLLSLGFLTIFGYSILQFKTAK